MAGNGIDNDPFAVSGPDRDVGNAGSGAGAAFDPSSFGLGNGTGSNGGGTDSAAGPSAAATGKRRGRPPGSKNSAGGTGSKTGSQGKVDVTGLEKMLYGIHAMAAIALEAKEFAISEDESKQIAKALVNVQQHYEMTISPETMAWINLGMVAASIYGPRTYIVVNRKRREKADAKKKAAEAKANSGNVFEGNFTNVHPVT